MRLEPVLPPVLPPVLLAALAVVLVVARAVTFERVRTQGGGWPAVWRWSALTGAGLLLLMAGLGPVVGDARDTVPRPAGDRDPSIFVVLDRSPEMAQSGAREDIAALIERYPHARFAVIGFADRPSLQWPLSADTWGLRAVVSALDAHPATAEGRQTNVGAAAGVLRYQLISAAAQFPRAQNLVFYLGAGAPESQAPQRGFQLPEDTVDGGAVLGYGTAGTPALRAVADQIGVPFVPRTGDTPLAAALPGGPTPDQAPAVTSDRAGVELYWVFAGAAGLLVLVELYLVLRELRRMQSVDVGSHS
ncbi:VWA domain-containing protein [Mycobacterium sp. TNTM28]|uniref:VWA domain-containing protein n=1 Tax=[Mycobacterium] fortunisiensis TaxID=2600579 RepID=A0ABS6KUS1_9MYCO|nr:vWA domain-containing protein [[Mycobacterium] fortunisiensis]MBU9767323.1 VWA domain-containing protein [[Mycobacterium] fortunisiensis]